jgi:hypothetical protein
MIERTDERFELYPERLAGDSAYGSGEMLEWLVHERGIEPHVPVFDKSKRSDGSFSRDDFTYDHQGDVYFCPAGKMLTCKGTVVNDNRSSTAPANTIAMSCSSSLGREECLTVWGHGPNLYLGLIDHHSGTRVIAIFRSHFEAARARSFEGSNHVLGPNASTFVAKYSRTSAGTPA